MKGVWRCVSSFWTSLRFRYKALLLLALTVYYNEILVYQLQYRKWSELNCSASSPTSCLKVLIVADPQLIGYTNDHWLIGWLARWDADRFLRLTFLAALEFVQPNQIIFGGDSFDEGTLSETTRKYWPDYWDRFEEVFKGSLGRRWVQPGDNDFSTRMDIVEFPEDRLRMFKERYQPNTPDVTAWNGVSFIHDVYLSNLYGYKPDPGWKNDVLPLIPKNNISIIMLSHFNYLIPNEFHRVIHTFKDGRTVERIYILNQPAMEKLKILKPDFIFSGHVHKAGYCRIPKEWDKLFNHTVCMDINPGDQPVTLPLKDSYIWEIVSPSCSYRMGYPLYGYTSILIDTEAQTVTSTVLFSSSRMAAFFLYSYVCIWLAVITTFHFIVGKYERSKTRYELPELFTRSYSNNFNNSSNVICQNRVLRGRNRFGWVLVAIFVAPVFGMWQYFDGVRVGLLDPS